MIPTTEVAQNIGLKIKVFDGSYNNGKGRFLSEPEIIKNSLLELMFEPEELESLVLVKINSKNPDPKHLKPKTFDGVKRQLTFSSGNNYYFADDELRAKIGKIFQTEEDTACRYGSLLVSNCFKGAEQIEGLRLKIVDYNSKDPQEKAEAEKYKTGDCHGQVSPSLVKLMGGLANRPFQFRFAWLENWVDNSEQSLTSFLAKGTLLPNATLEAEGFDIVMDRSSIKGIKKTLLPDLISCGEYEFPKSALGNRGNAKVIDYDNSWQFSIWYSEEALKKDFVEATQKEAEKLAKLQRNPLALAKHIVEEYDKKQQRAKEHAALSVDDSLERENTDKNQEQQELRLVTVLRNDKFGLLIDSPFVADAMRQYVANRWCDLAIKGAFKFSSGMAMPCTDLERGTICVPHLSEGDIITTRFPIVSSDNIRRYTNVHKPELMKYKGVVFMQPKDAEEYHQADFDGDQMVVAPSKMLPHIAAETLRAGETRRYAEVKQRPKVPYTAVKNAQGKQKYKTLSSIAAASSQNKIGLVATTIGRVQSSVPNEDENPRLFERKKTRLLNRLFIALQPEVDYQKSAERLEDIKEIDGENLLPDSKKWSEAHPSYFFDFKKDNRLYKTFPMPAEEPNPINVIPREAVNPHWEATRIRHRERHEFRYLFPKETFGVDELEWAEELKKRSKQDIAAIAQRIGDDKDAFNEELGKLYDSYRAEIDELFPTKEERFRAAAATWHTQHTKLDIDSHREECLKIAKTLKMTFSLEPDYELLHEALPRDIYVLQVPFGKKVQEWKESLDQKGIEYEATVHPGLPLVEFALKSLSPLQIEKLEAKYGNNYNDIDSLQMPNNVMIVPPADCAWVESRTEPGKAAIAYHLFIEEIVEQLQQFQLEEIKVLGIKYNDYAKEDFASKKWKKQKITLEVGTFDLTESHPEFYRYNGIPIIQIDGKNLGTFAPDTPKLPIGTTFHASLSPLGATVVLNIDPNSIRLPAAQSETQTDTIPQDNTSSDWRKEMQDLLFEAVSTTYKRRQEIEPDNTETKQFKIGNSWTAYVQPNGDFFVRSESKRTICKGNIHTGEEVLPLSDAGALQLQEMIILTSKSAQLQSPVLEANSKGSGKRKEMELA